MNGRDFSRLALLVVDDNEFSRSLIKTMLAAFRAKNVREARDGEEARAVLKQHQIDIVLCDYAMQPMSGLEFTRRVRDEASSPNPFVPIIMITAHSSYEEVCATRDAGVNEYLVKPFSAQALADRMLSVIDHSRPFVRSPDYFGPDRRRHTNPDHAGPWRRESDEGTRKLFEQAPTAATAARRKPG